MYGLKVFLAFLFQSGCQMDANQSGRPARLNDLRATLQLDLTTNVSDFAFACDDFGVWSYIYSIPLIGDGT